MTRTARTARRRSGLPIGLLIGVIAAIVALVMVICIMGGIKMQSSVPDLHFTVGLSACLEEYSCYAIAKDSVVGSYACQGYSACRQYNTFVRISDYSCLGAFACHALAPGTVVGRNSCQTPHSCECCSGNIPDNTPSKKCECNTGPPPVIPSSTPTGMDGTAVPTQSYGEL